MIRIPGDNRWFQDNSSNKLGTVAESFNIDPESNDGVIRLTRTKRVAYTGSPTGFGEIAALEVFDQELYVASENASGDDIWVGGNSPFDGLTNDATSVEIIPTNTDFKSWNSGLYIATGEEIRYSTDGATWTEIGSDVLSAGDNHLLEAMNAVLYVTDEAYKVKSVTSSNTFQGSGSQTLNLNLPGYVITMLCRGLDSLWVGLSNISGGSSTYVFEWDGQTANTATARYEIDAPGIMSGCVKDGVPYLVDSRGRLMVMAGGVFVEVARFPLNGRSFSGFANSGHNDRAIHPRGMTADADEVLINVANRTDAITDNDYNEFPSGVWAYSDKHGLYHKYSASYQSVVDTGTTNMKDYGQVRAFSAGPIIVMESSAIGGDPTPNNGGRVVFALEYFTDADDTSSDTQWGLFADDTNDNTQKAGTLTFPRIMSSNFRDTWEKIYTAVSDLVTTGDLVEVKYRTKDVAPVYADITWTGADRFSTNTELTAFGQGDEVTIVQGKGAGAVIHAAELTSGSGSEVILDRAPQGIVVGETAVVKLENYKKAGKITDLASEGFGVGKQDHWLQVKLYMQWTGPRELYGILIKNSSSLS